MFGALPTSDGEIALLTRSILGIFAEAGAGVEVPASDLEEGRATKPVTPETSGEVTPQSLVRVQASPHKPDSKEVFAAVQYRGSWNDLTLPLVLLGMLFRQVSSPVRRDTTHVRPSTQVWSVAAQAWRGPLSRPGWYGELGT